MFRRKKILFLHGFYASGQCVPALALRETFEGCEVLTPDLTMHPKEALAFIHELTEREKPDVLVGNSCGAFYAQMVAPRRGHPCTAGKSPLSDDGIPETENWSASVQVAP